MILSNTKLSCYVPPFPANPACIQLKCCGHAAFPYKRKEQFYDLPVYPTLLDTTLE